MNRTPEVRRNNFRGSVFFHGERFSVFSAFHPQEICRERQKMLIVGRRNAKNIENSPSLVFFHQKLSKIAFRLQATSEKWEKLCFGASRKVEIQKNSVSGCPDELFFVKMNRRGAPKREKSEKYAFGESRSSKNLKSGSSGRPET